MLDRIGGVEIDLAEGVFHVFVNDPNRRIFIETTR